MGMISNKISRDMLQPGDHIYSWRKAFVFSHHGIYVGNGRVIHYTCEGVLSSSLDCFLAGGSLYRFEYSASSITFLAKPRGGACTTVPSDLPEEVVYRANYLLQHGFGVYHVITNNCESFAVYCKISMAFIDMAATSSQVLSGTWALQSCVVLLTGVTAVTVFAPLVAGAGAGLATLVTGGVGFPVWFATFANIGRLIGDKRLKNCRKVPVQELVSRINAGLQG